MKRGSAAKNSKKAKTLPISKDPKVFETAFRKRLGQSPADYLVGKIQSGSSVSSVEYLFDIVSAEIAAKNHCEWLGNYMALTIRESTMDSYKTMTKHYINPYLGDEKIGSVTTADIQQLYNWLRENGRVNEHYEKGNALSDSMIRSIHMMLHQAMDAAVRERIIVKNPTEGTVIPKNNYPPKQMSWERQKAGYRGCYFRSHRGWISGIWYPHGGRCQHRRSGLASPYLLPVVSPQWNYQKADTR